MAHAMNTRLRRRMRSPAGLVGLLVGLAAATPGLASPLPGVPVRPWHVFVLLAFAVGFLFRLQASRGAFRRLPYLDGAVLLFTLVSLVVEIINAGYLSYSADYMTVARPLFWLVVYWSTRFVLHSMEDAARFLTWFALPALPSVAIGFGQVLGIDAVQQLVTRLSPDSSAFISRLEDGRLIRATGFVQHWTSFGSYLCTVVAAAMSLLILARVHRVGKERFAWFILCVAGLGVLTTLTLASIITAFVIFVLCSRTARAAWRAAPLIILTALVSVASLGSLFAERIDQQFATSSVASSDGEGSWLPSTLQYRYNIWVTETIPMVRDRPLTGWGTNVYEAAILAQDPKRIYPYQLVWASPESQWFNLLMTYGIAGTLSFVLVLFFVIRLLSRAGRAGAQWISRPTAVLFYLMLVAAFTAPVFTNHGLPIGLWTLLAVLAAFTCRSDEQHGSH